ncbi:hypothetical protein [Methylocella tundrae]|uniref:Uncharacterized protein n=1 Tax=Methylocella tundrae TaxID=227605 RepID=A0A4U8YZY1_METTU|nr:hypothetical protein [Methylocella tundrae]WPP04786.1 hypothetical protein SIN04_02835 [Methylocella tundrae]VFU07004.1 conserved protein of unknown function [Methylocella tundrae]
MSLISRISKAVAPRDLMLAVGLGLLGYGLSLVSVPAAFAAPGAILIGVAIFGVH